MSKCLIVKINIIPQCWLYIRKAVKHANLAYGHIPEKCEDSKTTKDIINIGQYAIKVIHLLV